MNPRDPETGRQELLRIEEVDALTLRVAGEVDLTTAGRFEAALRERIHPGQILTVDLAGLSFIDSSGIRALIRVGASLDGVPCLRLRSVRSNVARLFEIMDLAELPGIELA